MVHYFRKIATRKSQTDGTPATEPMQSLSVIGIHVLEIYLETGLRCRWTKRRVLNPSVRRGRTKQISTREIETQLTCNIEIAFNTSDGTNGRLRIMATPNTFTSPSRIVFSHTWLRSRPSSLGNLKISGSLTCPKSSGRSPLKNAILKYAWSRARMKLSMEVVASANCLSRCRQSWVSLSTKKGLACLGMTWACHCSALTSPR